MAYRRRGRWRRRRNRVARSLWRLRMRELHMVEFSPSYYNITAAYNAGVVTANLCDIAEGTGWDERSGNRITLHKIDLKGQVFADNGASLPPVYDITTLMDAGHIQVCLLAIRTREATSAVPTLDQIYNVQAVGQQTRNLNNLTDWDIIWRKNLRLPCYHVIETSAGAYSAIDGKRTFRVSLPIRNRSVRYTGTGGGTASTGKITFMAYVNYAAVSNGNRVRVQMSSRIRFHG